MLIVTSNDIPGIGSTPSSAKSWAYSGGTANSGGQTNSGGTKVPLKP